MVSQTVRRSVNVAVNGRSDRPTRAVLVNELQINSYPLTEKRTPYRFRCIGTVGTPLLCQGVWCRVRTLGTNPSAGQKPVNDLSERSGTVTLTVHLTDKLTVTVTEPNRYGRVQ